MLYKPVHVYVLEKIHKRLKVAITQDGPVSIKVKLPRTDGGNDTLLHTCMDDRKESTTP